MVSTAAKVAATVTTAAVVGAIVARKRSNGGGQHQVARGVTIDRPPARVYDFLRDPVELLGALDEQALKWARRLRPELVEEQHGQLLTWRSTVGPVALAAQVTLAEAPNDRGTELMVMMRYDGHHGNGKDPDLVLRTNLRRIKQMLEAGTIIEVQGQPTGRGPIQERLTRKVQDKLTVGGRP